MLSINNPEKCNATGWAPNCLNLEKAVVKVDVEGGGVDVQGLALAGQDGEHRAHHQ